MPKQKIYFTVLASFSFIFTVAEFFQIVIFHEFNEIKLLVNDSTADRSDYPGTNEFLSFPCNY